MGHRRERVGRVLAGVLLLASCGDAAPKPTPISTIDEPASATTASAAVAVTAAPPPGSAAAALAPPPSSAAGGAPTLPEGCVDLVDARGAIARETDVARRAPGRGPRPGQIRGVDASSRAPWRALKEQGFAFAFAQTGFGMTPNPAFADNWATMKRCGFPRGAYHFVNADRSGVAQAEVFLRTLGDDRGELPPTIDLEKPPHCADDCCGKTCAEWRHVVQDWTTTVARVDGRTVMIYAVEPFWNQCLCGTRGYSGHPLWMPAWPRFDFPDPVRYGGWPRWDFYQYDGNVKVGDGVIDINLFRGSREDLDAFIASTARR